MTGASLNVSSTDALFIGKQAFEVLEVPGETLVIEKPRIEILEVSEQGPPGAPVDANGAFLVINRLSELSTEQAKHDARTNLGLQVIDGGTFN